MRFLREIEQIYRLRQLQNAEKFESFSIYNHRSLSKAVAKPLECGSKAAALTAYVINDLYQKRQLCCRTPRRPSDAIRIFLTILANIQLDLLIVLQLARLS
jgi:hypothetical protein